MAEITASSASLTGSITAPPAKGLLKRKRTSRWKMNWVVKACFGWIVLLVVMAVFASVLAPHDPLRQNLMTRNIPPFWMSEGSWDHPLGTDQIGYDILSRIIYGARPSLEIGLIAAIIGLVVGTTLGLIAGYFRGLSDAFIMLVADTQLSTPFLVIAIAAVAAFGQSMMILIILAGISGWMGFARTIRAQVLTLRNRDFVVASEAIGANSWRILWRHMLPNITSTIIVLVTISFRGLILFEASMSFLGLGVPPPNPAWGSMISNGRDYLLSSWWISVFPGVALMLTVLAVSFIGDWLRDVLDPTLNGVR
ncbi:ABC transporter permease [soil metagenome]